MLKGYNNNLFYNKNINSEGIIFFVQRWTELFASKTISSYQFYITNSIVGLHEILDIIDKTLDGSFTTLGNFEACSNELLEIVKNDSILINHEKGIYNRLLSHLATKVKSIDNRPVLLRLKNEYSYLLKKIEPKYQNYIMEDLLTAIEHNDFKSIEAYTKLLASMCIHKGWTPHGALNLVKNLFFKNISINEDEEQFNLNNLWLLFKASLDVDKQFDMYIRISFNHLKDNPSPDQFITLMKRSNLEVLTTDEIKEKHPISQFKSNTKYIHWSTTAKDFYAASHKLVNYINSKITILSFYNKLHNQIDDSVIYLFENNNSKVIKVKKEDLYDYNAFLDSSNKVFENTMNVYSNQNINIKTTQNALKCVFNYANISSCSVFPEEKFINLWIALESFMKTGQYGNIISHIKEVLPAITCKRYIYKLVRNFAEDCIRCKVSFNVQYLNINLKSEKKQELVKLLIAAIKDPISYNKISTLCSVNSLLKFRLIELHDILENNKSLREKIEKHHQTVSWQIQRLYRIRNEIAHSALLQKNYINTYIGHLYDYLAILISEVIYVCSENIILCINEILPYLKDNFDVFMNIDIKKSSQDFLLEDGVINCL
ncbi:hypothetical protein [Intestinibacter bartlettii]|uniref:hypothetical protein n=1 Tax=Intestinibacter bartlettii TaxID=261299 RepID=UPI00319E41DE